MLGFFSVVLKLCKSYLLYQLGLANGEKVQRFDEAIDVNKRIEIWIEYMSLCFIR